MWENIIFPIIFHKMMKILHPKNKSLINHLFCFTKNWAWYLSSYSFFFKNFLTWIFFSFPFLLKQNIITYLHWVWDTANSALGEDWTHFDHNVGVSEEKVRDPHLWPPITTLMNRQISQKTRVLYESCTSLVQV